MKRLFLTLTLLSVSGQTFAQPVPFSDPSSHLWGYKDDKGTIVIPPRYSGASQFNKGRAAVEDDSGFTIINEQGEIIERISKDAVDAAPRPLPPPSNRCAWSGTARFPDVSPSRGIDCYIKQFQGRGPSFKAEIIRQVESGEGWSRVAVSRFANGVVYIHDQGYEGSRKRLLLPGVSAMNAKLWQQKLYPDAPLQYGCSEEWTSGVINGGAYIEQAYGC